MISENLNKGHQIMMDVNLVKKGNEDKNNKKTAVCVLNDDIIFKYQPIQGKFSCTILNVTDESTDSFVFKSSKYIAGIPQDKIFLNPKFTEKYIFLGKLKDYSLKENIDSEPVPSFNSIEIDDSDCSKKGRFIIKGNLTSNLSDDIVFELPFAYPENVTAKCSIKSGQENDEREIECETNQEFKNNKIMIAQTTILNSNKSEILIISKIEAENNTRCLNAKTQQIETKLESDAKISFRQINRYIPLGNNKASFHFIGVSDKPLSVSGKVIIIVVYVIDNNGKKQNKEANCNLGTFNAFNSNYWQNDFYCEVNSTETPLDIEIISSKEIMGIDENLEDYQKSPKKTDEMIIKTKNEPLLGRVLNYSDISSLNDIPPTLEIESMNISDCIYKGKIKVVGKFSKKINKKFDFTIPFSYPSSSIKCTAPKIDADRFVTMNCKIQKDFFNVKQFFIEPRIIKKKHQEVIYIKNFSIIFNKTATCNNYYTIQKNIEEEKYNMNYTFLQASNFRILPKILIFFKIFIYSLVNDVNHLPPKIPINIFARKRRTIIRNLDEPSDEQEDAVECYKDDVKKTLFQGYNCTSENIKVDNEREFESFYLESDNIPGLYEENSNPIETDINIKNLIEKNYTNETELKVCFFKDIKINTTTNNASEESSNQKSCRNNGTFQIEGECKSECEIKEKKILKSIFLILLILTIYVILFRKT